MAITNLTETTWQLNDTLYSHNLNINSHDATKLYALDVTTWFKFNGVKYKARNSGYFYYGFLGPYNTNYSRAGVYPCIACSSTLRNYAYGVAYYATSDNEMGHNTDTKIYFTIHGGTDATNVALISWLEAHATLLANAPAEIVYNGATTSVEAGKKAILACAGKKALSDVMVVFGMYGVITYGEKQTNIEAGQTATLECAGKRMKTDVVVERKVTAQEYETYKGGWYISGQSVYATSDPVVTYAFPVEAGATYTITMTEIGSRLRRAFTAVDPATFAGGETNVLTQFVDDGSSLAVGYSFEYTATADGWYLIYVSNQGETPNIQVLMSG